MAKRGFFDELNRQIKIAEQNQRRQQLVAERERAQAVRAYERALREAERAALAQQKADEKADKQAYLAMKLAEVDELNASLKCVYAELDGILESTLSIDDYVDLETLRITDDKFPAFDPGELGEETPKVKELILPPEPMFNPPSAPSGISGLFGNKKHAELVQTLRNEFEHEVEAWKLNVQQLKAEYQTQLSAREAIEKKRVSDLEAATLQHLEKCKSDAERSNQELDALIRDLAFDVPDAVDEYISIVMGNSVYPDAFQVSTTHSFDLSTREIAISVSIPGPEIVPTTKEYKYVKAQDAITSTELPISAVKSRYNSIVTQVAIRTLHEIFEADRNSKISSISLTVGTNALNKATGNVEDIPFVVVSAGREKFLEFNLAQVDALATLKHLGASISKNPFELQATDTNRGIRTGGR